MLPKCHRCCKRQMFLVPILSKTVCLLHRVSISQGSLCEVGMCFFPMECSQNALLWGLSLKCHIRALCLLFIHGAIFLTSLKSKAPWCIYFHCEEKLASYAWMTENVYWACPVLNRHLDVLITIGTGALCYDKGLLSTLFQRAVCRSSVESRWLLTLQLTESLATRNLGKNTNNSILSLLRSFSFSVELISIIFHMLPCNHRGKQLLIWE